jgi:hypothetical protein
MIKNLKASEDIMGLPNGSAVAVEGPSEVIVEVLPSIVKDMTEQMRVIKVQQTGLGEGRIYCDYYISGWPFTYASGTD